MHVQGPKLTVQQKIFYEENGFIVIEKLMSGQFLDEMRQRFIDLCNGETEHQVQLITKDPSLKRSGLKGEYLVNKFQDFAYDPIFWKYINYKPMVDIVEQLIGSDITAIHSMLINKPPNADPGSSLHPLHQDLHYFPYRPADKILGVWTAMERVDENNGCLYAIPGSHKNSLYPHTYPEGFKKAMYYGVQGFDHLKKTYIVMETGDTIFFHPLLLHGSGPNRTQGFRKAISCHYANNNCEIIDVRGTSQENIAKEVEGLVGKLVSALASASLKYEEFFKLKGRLVRGKPGNLQNLSSNL